MADTTVPWPGDEEPNTSITFEEVDALLAKISAEREKADALKIELTQLNVQIDELEQKAIRYLKALNRTNYNSPLGKFGFRKDWQYKLPQGEENRQAYFNYLREKGLFESMVTVNSNTHKAFCKAEQAAAAEQGNVLGFSIPGVEQPTLREIFYLERKR